MSHDSRTIQPPNPLRIYNARASCACVGPIRRINRWVPAKLAEIGALGHKLFALFLHELEPCESLFHCPSDVCLGKQDWGPVFFNVVFGDGRETARTLVVRTNIGATLFVRPKPLHLRVKVVIETKKVN